MPNFSVYLLKEGFDHSNSLNESHSLTLIKASDATRLPSKATMYIRDAIPKDPWWKDFFGISLNLEQVLKGAIVFLPINVTEQETRCFALTFGHAYHDLKDISYEYDFGIKVTLNTLDPNKVKATDTLSPESSKLQRIQSATTETWTFFDFKQDESIIKKLQGSVQKEYKELLKNVTGTSSLKFNSPCEVNGLISLCLKLFEIYKKDDYKKTFPDLQSIAPVTDPSLQKILNDKLLEAFTNKSIYLTLAIPEILDIESPIEYYFSGDRTDGNFYDDVYIEYYRKYLENKKLNNISINIL